MMREKINIYRQYAQLLLGNADATFAAPFGDSSETNKMGEAMFLSFKRLFVRDGIKRETFAMSFFRSASMAGCLHGGTGQNIIKGTESGSVIFTDVDPS